MTEEYQEEIAKEFEVRNVLVRFKAETQAERDAMCTAISPTGKEFQEILVAQHRTGEEATRRLGICLDGFVDTWRMHNSPASTLIRVYWRIMPEVCQSDARPFLWRGYARLVLG